MGIPERWNGCIPVPADIAEKIRSALPPLFEREGVVAAYLFGSLAQGKEPVDVDIGFVPSNGGLDEGRLREFLIEAIGTDRLDLVDLSRASPLLRFEVVSTGRKIYARSADDENRFELAVLREYMDTQHLRDQQRKILNERIAEWCSKSKQ